jgi:hypothetical protein
MSSLEFQTVKAPHEVEDGLVRQSFLPEEE